MRNLLYFDDLYQKIVYFIKSCWYVGTEKREQSAKFKNNFIYSGVTLVLRFITPSFAKHLRFNNKNERKKPFYYFIMFPVIIQSHNSLFPIKSRADRTLTTFRLKLKWIRTFQLEITMNLNFFRIRERIFHFNHIWGTHFII